MSFEFNNDENTWRRNSAFKFQDRVSSSCSEMLRKSTSITVIILGLGILSCLLGYCVMSESAPYDAKTLRMVSIVCRHGARTPTESYNSDPYKNYNWPDGWGSLTKQGKLQMFELGKKLRIYYGGFLPEDYFEKDLYAVSSDTPRTLMSAYLLLAGLFPPTEKQMWHPDLNWQPIPVHSLPLNIDYIIAIKKPCSRATKEMRSIAQQVNLQPEIKELYEYLTKYTNQTIESILTVDFLYATLLIEHEAGLKLPEWTKNVFPRKLEHGQMYSFAILTYNDLLKRLIAGPLLSDIISYMRNKTLTTNVSDKKIVLYSGHDVTITNLWRTLGLQWPLRPDYGASLVLELHEESDPHEYYVKAFYWNNTKVDAPMEVKIPICTEACTLKDFEAAAKKYISDDWEKECGNV